MSLATITSKELARVQRLIDRKEELNREIDQINTELEQIESGVSTGSYPAKSTGRGPASENRGPAPSMPRQRGRGRKTARGQLKERITNELMSAGDDGMRVKDLAETLGTSYGNVTAFFQSTGKKIREIKKVGPAKFAWVG